MRADEPTFDEVDAHVEAADLGPYQLTSAEAASPARVRESVCGVYKIVRPILKLILKIVPKKWRTALKLFIEAMDLQMMDEPGESEVPPMLGAHTTPDVIHALDCALGIEGLLAFRPGVILEVRPSLPVLFEPPLARRSVLVDFAWSQSDPTRWTLNAALLGRSRCHDTSVRHGG